MAHVKPVEVKQLYQFLWVGKVFVLLFDDLYKVLHFALKLFQYHLHPHGIPSIPENHILQIDQILIVHKLWSENASMIAGKILRLAGQEFHQSVHEVHPLIG